MQVYPISPAASATDPKAATPAVSTTGVKALGVNDFLKLLSVQMNAQDPMNPQKDTDFIAQMSSFTSLEQMKDLTSSMTSFVNDAKLSNAQNYLGKNVTLLDSASGGVTGVVTGVNFETGTPRITVNGKNYDPINITSIQTTAAPASTGNPAPASSSTP